MNSSPGRQRTGLLVRLRRRQPVTQAASTNELLGQSGVVGIKTGSTEDAGGCVVLARKVNDGNSLVITSVLGADLQYDANGMITLDKRWDDASQLLSFMDATFVWLPLDDAQTFREPADRAGRLACRRRGQPLRSGHHRRRHLHELPACAEPDGGGTIDIYYDNDRAGSLPLQPAAASARSDSALTLVPAA